MTSIEPTHVPVHERIRTSFNMFTHSTFDSTLVQHRHEPGLYLRALLPPYNICFPILDGTTLALEFKLLASAPLIFL